MDEFKTKVLREEEERKIKKVAQYHEWDKVIKAIGSILGMEFDQEQAERRDEERWNYHAGLKNGVKQLTFSTGKYKLIDRWSIGCAFPRDSRGQVNTGYNQRRLTITISASKSAEKIAKDIQSRLIPEYEKQLAEVIKRNEASDKYVNGKLAQISKVAEYLHEETPDLESHRAIYPHNDDNGIYIHKIEPHSETSVKMDVQCSGEKAVEILKLLGF